MLKGRKIGVLFGGISAEREVSLKSGAAVMRAVSASGLDALGIDAGKDVCAELKKHNIDLAFIALHGGTGEDGSIQGLLEVMGIPYTGSGVMASALAMDKEASKIIFRAHGVPVADYEAVKDISEYSGKMPAFGFPCVVKPAREGSSIGVSIVKEPSGLKNALKEALSFGGGAIVERYIKGKEIQIAVLNGKALGGVEVRPKEEFYNYAAKYTAGTTEYVIPPALDPVTYEKAKDIALRGHKALGCAGATRVDLIVTDAGEVFALEVNTIPGLTETSLLPKIAKHAGMDFPALIKQMLEDALTRHKGGGN